ncbi:Nbs-lrr resistance protein [Theobroma cacao]|uniref:Nbs-lrr resistance protein n=1 Tax=Theobroma cacao TaxID=3641 RepID=A0A061FEW8_THECC|nr:Nbs-lrr resistance protein [Theobroma cacao]
MQSPKCQKLTTLLLSNNSFKEIPESFFEHMPNLKILDLSLNYISNLPHSISNLENLTALLLRECCKLENDLCQNLALKKLNLERTSITKFPLGLEMLTNLRYLNLGFTFELEEIPDGLLSKLYHLQHLIIHPASSRAEEIKSLKKLEVFEGCFTNVHDLSMYAGQRKGPNKYHIWVSHKLIEHWVYNSYRSITFDRGYSRLVAICGCNMNAEDPIILPSDIRQLQLYHCKGRGSTLNGVFRTDLKECTIESCHELESIFTSWCTSLLTLEVLELSGLRNLKVIVGESVPPTPGTFSSLKVIYLTSCGKLKNLLPAKWVLQDLQNLEEIEVRSCKGMEEIIASKEEGMSTNNNVMFTLPKLRKLKLHDMPELKSICKTNEVMVCDSLQRIEITYCPKLKRIPLYLPLLELDNCQPSPPASLKEICINPMKCWESMEWDHPNAKNVLLPLLKFWDKRNTGWKQAIHTMGMKVPVKAQMLKVNLPSPNKYRTIASLVISYDRPTTRASNLQSSSTLKKRTSFNMDLIGPIIEVIKFIGQSARKCLRYHRKFSEYKEDFKQAQAELNYRKADIHQRLQEEHRFGKKPKEEVESWFKKVEEKLGQAQRVEVEVSKGKYLCRSCLGKRVDETTQAIKKVYDEGRFSGSLVVNDSSTIAAELPTQEITGDTNVIQEIYKDLMGDEVRMIGVCGMGGIGKTTIMKHVHNRLLNEGKFKKLIWATVSQDLDVRRLQKDIASQLKEKLKDDENAIVRAAKLSEMLRKQGSYVLILDDVWSSFSLEDVGILKPTADNGCKLVLTTRSAEVVRSMGCKKVLVPCLSMDEAMQLFLSKVGQDMLPSPTLEWIMKDVLRECDGLPLAIVTIAGCMRGIFNPLEWNNALNELRGYIRNIPDVEDKVFRCLKFSYDRLNQKDRDCFLYCALFPEDYEIEKKEIVEYWMEEGLIDELGTRQAMQDSGHFILQKLEENYLLERVRAGTHIKMHDVVRDMALHITRKRFLVKAGKQLEELPDKDEWGEDLEKISLMRNDISKIPQNMQSPKCQNLITLLLSNNHWTEIPESFFEYMPNLKILDLSWNRIQRLPNSITNLEKLTALLLCGCKQLEDVPSLSKLQALKKLNLERTEIKKIPQGLEMLINLRYLNLRYTTNLEVIPDGILPKLYGLQHFSILPAFSRAEETKPLNKLEAFEVCFKDVHDLSMYARQRKRPNKYHIWVSPRLKNILPYKQREGPPIYGHLFRGIYSKSITVGGFNMKIKNPIILPYDIQALNLHKCEFSGSSLNNIFGLEEVTDLTECAIASCNELESIFSSRCASLQTLEVLKLVLLWNLEVIVGESIPPEPGTFSNLRCIYIIRCGKLKNLFSAKWVLQNLHNLKEIHVWSCEEMEEIIASEKEGMSTDNNVMFTLPKLKVLTLSDLPQLKSICKTNDVRICDSLQRIEIRNCRKLKRIPLYLPLLELDNSQPSPPPSLKEICIDPKEWWESVEWDHPDAKNVLLPLLKFWDDSIDEWKQAH